MTFKQFNENIIENTLSFYHNLFNNKVIILLCVYLKNKYSKGIIYKCMESHTNKNLTIIFIDNTRLRISKLYINNKFLDYLFKKYRNLNWYLVPSLVILHRKINEYGTIIEIEDYLIELLSKNSDLWFINILNKIKNREYSIENEFLQFKSGMRINIKTFETDERLNIIDSKKFVLKKAIELSLNKQKV